MPKQLRSITIEHGNPKNRGKAETIIKNINEKYSAFKISDAMGKDLKVGSYVYEPSQEDPWWICLNTTTKNTEVCQWLLDKRIAKETSQFRLVNLTAKQARDTFHF